MPEKSVRDMSALERQHHSLATRVWRSLIMMSVILAVVAIIVGLVSHAYALLDQYLAVGYNYASSAADVLLSETDIASLSEEFMDTYRSLSPEEREGKGTLEYQSLFVNEGNARAYYRAHSLLEGLESNDDIRYIYLGMYDAETGALVYIIDPDSSNPYGAGDWDPVPQREIDYFLKSSGSDQISYVGYTDEYGWMGTSGYPIRNENGTIVSYIFVDILMKDIVGHLASYAAQYCIIMFVVINIAAFFITRHMEKMLVEPINQIAEAAETYVSDREANGTGTDHFSKLGIRTGDEIENLSLVMADMERGLADYEDNLKLITAEKQRINTELGLATTIQSSMLPSGFPPFPDRSEFDIYAIMDPAKEVGGDFYDFFMIDDDHLAMVIADVSGKGVPAALYMMMTKILISDHAQQGGTPAEVLEAVNRVVCANNTIDMFITVWLGILDIRTGTVTAASAGHEYPAVRAGHGQFELLHDQHGFVVGGMEGSTYRDYEFTLEPGGCLFVYTDGVPEATDAGGELFGSERMLEALNRHPDGTSDDIIDSVLVSIEHFVGDAPQFDDLTMLCMHYQGPSEDDSKETTVPEMTIEATLPNIPIVTEFVNTHLEALDCPLKARMQIDIAIDELFSNIARYAYTPETGPATVRVDVDDDPLAVIVTFIDHGVPYDPLEASDPDITLPAEERAIGGLGIFLVKQTMDDITYEYKNGQNILRIKKEI